jgi:acetylornithine deacetylase/succinyl-diaminopimelate desuccinylase-like protein
MLNRSPDRVLERLDELYAIGGGRGANRIGYSAEEDRAHELAAGWMEEAGLEIERDAAGNLVGRLLGRRPELPEVWAGSHLDSVPEGGRFDGALGVVAALEAAERAGRGERTLGVVAFRAEETGCQGSRARCGAPEGLPGAFVEVHVEQGPRLASAGVPLGVVTGIVGYVRGAIRVEGRPGHAGTTPMGARDDALCKAAEVVLAVRDAARSIDGAVATVGEVEVEPGAANVIPARVTLSVDARAPNAARLDELVAAIGFEPGLRVGPVAMDPGPRAALAEEAENLGVELLELPSGAGHDAGILAAAGVPSAMLFVRSLAGGISHAPEEESSPDDVALAVDVLTATLARLAASLTDEAD